MQSTPAPTAPPKPVAATRVEETPKADINTLAYLLKEIDIKIETQQTAQRRAGMVMFTGGILLGVSCVALPNLNPFAPSALLIVAFGFSKLF